jgi:hypothetical protein
MSVYKIKPSIREQSTLFLKSCKYIKGHEDVQSHIDFLNNEKLLKKVELINTLLIPDESIIAYIGCNNLEIGLNLILTKNLKFVHFIDSDQKKLGIINSISIFDKEKLEDKIKWDNVSILDSVVTFDFVFCFELERFIFYNVSFDDFFQKLKKITRKILIIEWCTSFKDDPNYSKKIFKENLAKYFSLIKKIEKNIYIAFK